jgi:hypothetical protein
MKRELDQDKESNRCVWTPEEDRMLRESALKHKGEYWNQVAEDVKLYGISEAQIKTAKQCRERWNSQVNPKISSNPLSSEEIDQLYSHHKKFGNRWSKISSAMSGRTDNIVKNYFLCKLRKVVRCVKKGTLKGAEPSNEAELFHLLYLMDYLYKYYISPEREENVKKSFNSQTKRRKNNGDQYVNQMIQDKDITPAKLGVLARILIDSSNFTIDQVRLQEYGYMLDLKAEYNSDFNSHFNTALNQDVRTDTPITPFCNFSL